MVRMTEGKLFYDLKELMPTVYGKYIIVKSSDSNCIFRRLFSVADAVIASRKRWTGYNIFVDWYDGGVSPFYTYFKLNITNEFATNYSDMPAETKSSILSTPISRDQLFSDPESVTGVADHRCVIYDSFYEYVPAALDSKAYDLMFQSVLRNSLKPQWRYGKMARGYHSDKYKNKFVVACDSSSIVESNKDQAFETIDRLLLKNLRSRIYIGGHGSKYFDELYDRYIERASFRRARFDDSNQDKLLDVIQMSLCDFLVGSSSSAHYIYAKNFLEPTNVIDLNENV